jgi:hypothetical protein
VARERLVIGAYADLCPMTPEPAPDDRNGRVLFKVVAVNPDGHTKVRRGCPAATQAGLSPPVVELPKN